MSITTTRLAAAQRLCGSDGTEPTGPPDRHPGTGPDWTPGPPPRDRTRLDRRPGPEPTGPLDRRPGTGPDWTATWDRARLDPRTVTWDRTRLDPRTATPGPEPTGPRTATPGPDQTGPPPGTGPDWTPGPSPGTGSDWTAARDRTRLDPGLPPGTGPDWTWTVTWDRTRLDPRTATPGPEPTGPPDRHPGTGRTVTKCTGRPARVIRSRTGKYCPVTATKLEESAERMRQAHDSLYLCNAGAEN